MINKIWAFFIITGILFGILTNNVDTVNKQILESGKTTINMILEIFPLMAIWLGIMKIAETSKLLDKFSKILYPILKKIFPEIPKNHKSFSYIGSNIIANLFGLGNAATPFGLKTMQELQKLNKTEVASRSMITFLVLNTSGLTIIPTTVISLRMLYKSNNPTEIVFACILATLISTIGGLIIDNILGRKNHE